jgi:acyl dehydratase
VRHFEDFQVGTIVQLGSRVMDREAILRFAGEFDRLPFHLDEAAAGQSIFGGLHTLSVAAGIVVDEYFVDTTMTGCQPGRAPAYSLTAVRRPTTLPTN